MPNNEAADFREFASELAHIAMGVVGANQVGAGVEIKRDGTPVTAVDIAVETALRTRIEAACPGHGIVGEELPPHNPDAEWVWVLDPIDGTNQFAAGLPGYGCLIALCRRGVPELGIVCQPDTGELYVGISGLGTWRNDTLVRSSPANALAATNLCITDPDAFDDALRPGMLRLREAAGWTLYEGGCLSFGALAAGRIGVSIYGGNLENFDICALVPVVEGAGGVISDWQGGALTLESSGEIVASANRELHAEVLRLLHAK